MRIALSPCPNDTHLFHAWINGLVGQKLPPEPTFADIETLNTWALEEKFPLIKVSAALLPHLSNRYTLLPVGAALGFGCGPKVIAHSTKTPKTVAIPGRHTTAHRLYDRYFPNPIEKHFCRYDRIFHLLETNVVDAGLIIHESRFTFREAGFIELADLGSLWEAETRLPLPLGCLVADKTLPIDELTHILRLSLTHTANALPFIQKHAQELSPNVIQKHIDLYVNQETHTLSSQGLKAFETLNQ